MSMRERVAAFVMVAPALVAVLTACGNGSGSGNSAANCVTTYSGQSDSCTVGAVCQGTIYRADCNAQPDGGTCTCDILDAGPSRTVPFQAPICAPLASTNDPTPNFNAANAACGWKL